MPGVDSWPVNVFISYAHEDEDYKDELMMFLNPMARKGDIKIWNDRAIIAGEEWDDEIKKALDESNVVLLLISPAFLASDYINATELKNALEQHGKNKKVIVPVMLRACDVNSFVLDNDEDTKISRFQGLPKNFIPVKKWADRDEAWMSVVNGLKLVLNKLRS
jgi:hypothetical protein